MIHTDHESCHGESCRQGRKTCQTPEACRLSEQEEERAGMQMLVYLFAVVAVVALALAIIIWG